MNATLLPDPEDSRVPIDKILPALAAQTARSEADKAMKLRVAGEFIKFMAGKRLGDIAPREVNAHHVSEWLVREKRAFNLANNSVRANSRCLAALFKGGFPGQ